MRVQRLKWVVGWSVMMGLLSGTLCLGQDDARAQGLDVYLQQLVPFGFSGTALVMEDGRVQHVGGYGYAGAAGHRYDLSREEHHHHRDIGGQGGRCWYFEAPGRFHDDE